MKRLVVLLIALLLVGAAALAQDAQDPVLTRNEAPSPQSVTWETVISGVRRPLYLTSAGDGSDRLFLVEQGGIIYVYDNDEQHTFLNVSDLVSPEANGFMYTERGLLGLAFHPNYAENGMFFINYTDREGHTKLVRYSVSDDDPNAANPDSAEIILEVEQPFSNHNGGHLDFGPDGYLYMSLGDGGSANDPLENGLNPQTLLGTIIRLDVDEAPGYAIPDDNPFVGTDTGAPEVWSYGLRNAWRFSFDRATGDMYIGDVGQNVWEEVNYEPAGVGGRNYGWNAMEGFHVFDSSQSAPNAVLPIAEYSHDMGCSVTGGYVYRGEAIPELQGVYFYGDYCTGVIWVAWRDAAEAWQSSVFLDTQWQISSFGEDEAGELYAVDYSGAVKKFLPAD